jgi:hypothetical protein
MGERRGLAPVALVLLLLMLVGALAVAGCEGSAGGATTTTTTALMVVPLPNDACLACHTDLAQKTANEDKVVFSHDLHLRQRITCVTCHATVGHAGTQMPSQATCDGCHGMAMPHPTGWAKDHGKTVDQKGNRACGMPQYLRPVPAVSRRADATPQRLA